MSTPVRDATTTSAGLFTAEIRTLETLRVMDPEVGADDIARVCFPRDFELTGSNDRTIGRMASRLKDLVTAGLVSRVRRRGKRLYTITDAGRAAVTAALASKEGSACPV